MTTIIGLVMLLIGAWIMVVYWIYWVRYAAMKLGYGKIKPTSMLPLAGPVLVIVGGVIAGGSVAQVVGAWVFLVDPNTYVLILSLLALPWRVRLKK